MIHIQQENRYDDDLNYTVRPKALLLVEYVVVVVGSVIQTDRHTLDRCTQSTPVRPLLEENLGATNVASWVRRLTLTDSDAVAAVAL